MAGRARSSNLGLTAVCAFVVVLGLWNAHAYPPGHGYDAVDHIAYADGLIPHWRLPHGTGEYYTPPGFYFVAGVADWVAHEAGLGEPHRATQALNVLLLLGTTILVYRIAQLLRPGRERFALGAAAFVAFVPVTVKAEAMFHPETLDLFCSTLALWLCVRLLKGGRSRELAIALGIALGCGQLVRAFSLWTLAAAVLALAAGRRWRELATVVAIAILIPAPWYIHQRLTYGGSPVFNRPTATKPVWDRRPVRFYVDPGLPDVITRPVRPEFRNLAIPTTYSELWGDYFGIWAWNGARLTTHVRRELELQSVVGLLPTLLAVVGWLAFLLGSLRSPPRLVVALLPLLGLVGYLYFTVSYPTHDGDVLKATYMLTTVAGWAIGFGYALERLRGRWLVAGTALVGLCALAELPFLVY